MNIDYLMQIFTLDLVNHLFYIWDDKDKVDVFANEIDGYIETLSYKNPIGCREVMIPYYTSEGLSYLWKYRQCCVHRWIDEALNAKQYDSFRMASLYWEIATFLISIEPETSMQIARRLSPFSSRSMWSVKICEHDVPKQIKDYREECILSSKSNAEIFDWALNFRHAENEDWEWAVKWLESDNPLQRSIAVQLLGWSGCEFEEIIHQTSIVDENHYVRRCAIKANEDWWREHWAKEWYNRLLHSETIEQTWAAQELFNLAADSRATFWFHITQEAMKECNWKQKGIIHNTLHNLKENDKKYSDAQKGYFFGQKVKFATDGTLIN